MNHNLNRRASPLPSPFRPVQTADTFVTFHFEKADYGKDSACALSAVRVEGEQIVSQKAWLIRPPRSHFLYSWKHGLKWEDVSEEKTFDELWPELRDMMQGARYFACYGAEKQVRILKTMCRAHGVLPPRQKVLCTQTLFRKFHDVWDTHLEGACQTMGIPMNPQDAASDSRAAAEMHIQLMRRFHEVRQKLEARFQQRRAQRFNWSQQAHANRNENGT